VLAKVNAAPQSALDRLLALCPTDAARLELARVARDVQKSDDNDPLFRSLELQVAAGLVPDMAAILKELREIRQRVSRRPFSANEGQCRKCHDRKSVCLIRGCAPPDHFWLQGREWGWVPPIPLAKSGMRSQVAPPPPTPESVQIDVWRG
jgi:hypothetical protein